MDDRRLDSSRDGGPISITNDLPTTHHLDSVAMRREPPDERGGLEVTMRDFVIECLSEGPALDGMSVVVYGLREDDTASTEKMTEKTWKYDGEIHLHLEMEQVIFSVESEDTYVVGYITFSKDELAAFRALECKSELQRDFVVLEKTGPSLRLIFTLGAPQKGSVATQSLTSQSEIDVTPEWHTLHMIYWHNHLGKCFEIRFEQTSDIADIDNAISIEQKAVDLGLEGHESMPVRLNNLGLSFRDRFIRTRSLSDIDNAIASLQRAIDLIPEGHADMPLRLNNLRVCLETRFDHIGSLADLDKAISAQQSVVDLTPEGHIYKSSWLNSLATSFQTRFDLTGNISDLENVISMRERAIDLIPEEHEDLPLRLNNISFSFEEHFNRTGNFSSLEKAISTQQKCIDHTPEGHKNMPSRLSHLGNCFQKLYNHTSNLADLESAISAQQSAVGLTPEGYADMPMWLNDLRLSYEMRFEHTANLADIDNAISLQQRAVALVPEGHVNMPALLNNLGISSRTKYGQTGNLADLELAISAHQRALDLVPPEHAYMPIWLTNLGVSLRDRFDHTGNIEDIENAISSHKRGIDLTPEGHPDLPMRLNALGASFGQRFDHTGNLADLETAISNQQTAIDLTPEGHANMCIRLNDLALSFRKRFDRSGNMEDIKSAIAAQKRAINLTPEGHAEMPSFLNNLGACFQTSFIRTGDLADIRVAISSQQRAIDLTPKGHADMPSRLDSLGVSFQTRFDHTGILTDIENAISVQQRATNLTPTGHTNMPLRLNNLGLSLQMRFNRTGNFADLENAIYTQQKAVNLVPKGYSNMPVWLNNLALSFQGRFNHTNNLADLEIAISTFQKAIDLTPQGHEKMPVWFNNLGISLRGRFNRTGNLKDLETAISNIQKAVDLTQEGHVDAPLRFNNLALCLRIRFNQVGNISDLERTISTQQHAVDLIPEGHGDNSHLCRSLAHSLIVRFKTLHNMEDIHAAIAMLRRSATQTNGNPFIRLKAAYDWAQYSREYDKSQLLDAFSIAIQLLPQVAGLEQTIQQRHQSLTNLSNITTSATAAAINDSKLDAALTWLEQGRCLVWNQLNYLRTPAEDLRTYNSSLADRFLHVAHALEVLGSRQRQHAIFKDGNMEEMISLQEEMHKHVHLANEWNELLQEIRCIPKFQDFLKPPQASKLLSRLSPDGPIVIFNIDKDRCDALVLISGRNSPIHVPLATFSLQRAIWLCDKLYQYFRNHHVRQQQEQDRGTFRLSPGGATFMNIVLHDLWKDVAKPILDALAYLPHPSNHPRIWWCPTGPLAFLPIHAAGIYGKDGGPSGPCVSDYVISSYTPTISALLDKIKATPTRDIKPSSVLIISQPSTPGQSSIPGAKLETQALKDMIQPPLKSLLLESASATVMQVKDEMKYHDWAHFACHAIQDGAEPLKSGVQLHDGRLEVLEMMKHTLPNADLAFLSACQTSTGDERLADEVVHLAASMLAAGYRSVVATMWSIRDEYGPVIAKDFYEHILVVNSGDTRLDGTNAARALHHATQKLRKELGDTEEALLTWVPYVHFGV